VPLFDIAALSLISHHKELYKVMLAKAVSNLRIKADEKREESIQS